MSSCFISTVILRGFARVFAIALVLLGTPVSAITEERSATRHPNIILILADDLGYGDPGCYGGKLVPTPHIDRLARDGARFTDAYATAPVCAPSRCGLMTGSYNQRFGCQWNEDEYLTDRIGRHAVEFIKRQDKKKQFFLNIGFNAPHSPYHAKKELMAKFGHLRPEPLNYYAAMVASMDENIGRILSALKECGMESDTLVVFTSDNGPTGALRVGWRQEWPRSTIVGSAGPLAGKKGGFLEGGIREPFIIRWPATLKPGITFSQPASMMDLHPTLCAAAGASIPNETKLDGVNLLPLLHGDSSGAPHKILFWKNGGQGAVRSGDWKLLLNGDKSQLFHLKEDIGETKDRARENPEIVKSLHTAWIEWSATLPPRANSKSKPAKQK